MNPHSMFPREAFYAETNEYLNDMREVGYAPRDIVGFCDTLMQIRELAESSCDVGCYLEDH